MAAGNQEEKGIWALFVISPKTNKIRNILVCFDKITSGVVQEWWLICRYKAVKINASPKRLISKVKSPDVFALLEL